MKERGGGRTKKLATDSEDDSNDVVLAFIGSDEEYVDELKLIFHSFE